MNTVADRRVGLAPYLGRRVRVRGVVLRSGSFRRNWRLVPSTLFGWVDLGHERVAEHCWMQDVDLTADGRVRRGDEVEVDADVICYEGYGGDPGRPLTKYGLTAPELVANHGPASLARITREMVGVWGFDAVADAVAAAHGGDGDD